MPLLYNGDGGQMPIHDGFRSKKIYFDVGFILVMEFYVRFILVMELMV